MIRDNRGFSLQEVMTVIGIIAVLATIAVPNLIGWLPKYRSSSGAREIMGALEHARMTAIRQNAAVDVAFDFEANSYRTSLDGNTLKAGTLAASVDLKEPSSSQSLGAAFRFNNQGMPVDAGGNAIAGSVVLAAGSHAPEKQIRVNAGGNVRIQ